MTSNKHGPPKSGYPGGLPQLDNSRDDPDSGEFKHDIGLYFRRNAFTECQTFNRKYNTGMGKLYFKLLDNGQDEMNSDE